jgi:hypothetical protein
MGACSSKGGKNTSGSSAQLFDNTSVIDSMKKDIKQRFETHQDQSTQKSFSSQNISIKQNIDPEIMNSPVFQTQTYEYWPWGTVKKGPCANYGCSYDIRQVGEIKVSSVKEDIINDVQEIWNTIKSKLKKNAEAKMTGNNKGLGIFNEALEKSNDEVNDTLSNMLTNVSEEDHTDSQRIEIEITSPIKCSDPCSENGNPELNQDAYIEMKTNDIINATLSIVHKNTSDLGLNTTMKTDDSNNACIIQMMGSLVCCIIILYLLISKG